MGQLAPAAGGPAVSNDDVAATQIPNMISKQDPGREAGPEVGAGPNPADLVKDNFAAPVAALLPGYPIFDSDAADNFTFDFLSPGTLVGVTAAPTNPLDADLVIYDLLDDAGGRFGIDSLTGMVFQTNGPALDFTAVDSYTICVRGQSPGRTPETAEFEIGVGTHFAGVVVLSADLAVGGEVVDQYRNRIVGNGLFTDTNDLGDYLLPYNQTAGATFDFGGPDATPRPRIAHRRRDLISGTHAGLFNPQFCDGDQNRHSDGYITDGDTITKLRFSYVGTFFIQSRYRPDFG